MPLYRPSDLHAFLNELKSSPHKRSSQNFLIDGNVVRKIMTFAKVKPGDLIVEIGPGPGVLTEALLERGADVVAIEKDRRFAKALTRLQTPDHRLTVLEEDVLQCNLFPLLSRKAKVVSNLPYHITTPILTLLLSQTPHFESIAVMVQKEVATRLLATPGNKDYSSLTIFVQFYSSPLYGFTVEPTCFYPPPTIQSAVVKFDLKQPPDISAESFFEMTRGAFQQRRKMVRTSLKKFYSVSSLERGLKAVGKGVRVRPEELSLSDFMTLFNEIKQK